VSPEPPSCPEVPPGPRTGAALTPGGPLLTLSAAAGVLRARVNAALHRLGHGDDGIAAGLDAEHGHGHTHSHGAGNSPGSTGGGPESDHSGDHHPHRRVHE